MLTWTFFNAVCLLAGLASNTFKIYDSRRWGLSVYTKLGWTACSDSRCVATAWLILDTISSIILWPLFAGSAWRLPLWWILGTLGWQCIVVLWGKALFLSWWNSCNTSGGHLMLLGSLIMMDVVFTCCRLRTMFWMSSYGTPGYSILHFRSDIPRPCLHFMAWMVLYWQLLEVVVHLCSVLCSVHYILGPLWTNTSMQSMIWLRMVSALVASSLIVRLTGWHVRGLQRLDNMLCFLLTYVTGQMRSDSIFYQIATPTWHGSKVPW